MKPDKFYLNYEENGVKVRFEDKNSKEKVLFFKIDDNQTDCIPKPGLRDFCYNQELTKKKLPPKSKIKPLEPEESFEICDLLIYYSKEDTKNDLLCLVELKGNEKELCKAVDQLNNTYSKLNKEIIPNYTKKYNKNVKWAGYICSSNLKRYESPSYELTKALKYGKTKNKFSYFDIIDDSGVTDGCEIGNYLRMIFTRIEKRS